MTLVKQHFTLFPQNQNITDVGRNVSPETFFSVEAKPCRNLSEMFQSVLHVSSLLLSCTICKIGILFTKYDGSE